MGGTSTGGDGEEGDSVCGLWDAALWLLSYNN